MRGNRLIVANWKMNKNPAEAEEFLKKLILSYENQNIDVVICPTFLCLEKAVNICKESNIKIGAQNCYFEKKGAFTGEISADMLASIGVEYVILGHSERRNYFCEIGTIINKKVKSALENNLKPIICIGETLTEREAGKEKEKIKNQIAEAMKNIDCQKFFEMAIAYEPIWAIGTGKTIDCDECEAMFEFIRNYLIFAYGKENAMKIKLLYGGSMNEKNAEKLLSITNVDGGLIGGASLDITKFIDILKQAESMRN